MLTIRTSRSQVSYIVFTGDAATAVTRTLGNENHAVVADRRVRIDLRHFKNVVRLQGGEHVKSISTAVKVARKLSDAGIDRKSVLIAVGGGSITDLAGFVASIYMRGIRYINVPTTLLAMVDAAIGGKTGVNSDIAKNALGTFHMPEKVVIDTGFLRTLPHRQLLNGFGEILKCAVIKGGELRRICARGVPSGNDLQRAVYLAAKCKVDIVNRDPFESSLRAVLNLGHTVGHAVEAASGFRIPHGYAVTFGLIVESSIGERLGVTRKGFAAEFKTVARNAGFSSKYDLAKSIDRFVHDKKRAGNSIVLALPHDWGRIEFPVKVSIREFATLCQSEKGF